MTIRDVIAAERAAIAALDSQLSNERTPFLKSRLLFATHQLDDSESVLRLADKSTRSPNAAMMRDWAVFCVRMASETRKKIEEDVNKRGGPANVEEH